MRWPPLKLCLALGLVVPFASRGAVAQTECAATLTVTTRRTNQGYDPRHVLAIWVSTTSNAFVKTIKQLGNEREDLLTRWRTASGKDTTDAITGATIRSHQTHVVTWDGTNVSGAVVSDGAYRFHVEFATDPPTPHMQINFTKGPEPDEVTMADQTYFEDISVSYVPTQTVVARGSTWRYNDQGVDLHATSWKSPDPSAFDDSSWSLGAAKFGYGDPATTPLDPGSDPDNKTPCYYFRHRFHMAYNPTYVWLRVLRDDGVVVYLNGSELSRNNMAAGTTQYAQYADSTVGGADEDSYIPLGTVPGVLPTAGDNVLAVELHQGSATSSDTGFDLQLIATAAPANVAFQRGDLDADGSASVTDAMDMLGILFQAATQPTCLSAADANDDGDIDISDPVTLLIRLYGGGPPLPPPYQSCDLDPTPDALICGDYEGCAA